jgi:hypothetical protein
VFSAERKLISMSHHLDVLQALLRLVRRRTRPSLTTLVHAIGAGANETLVRHSLFALARNGLIQRTNGALSLTLAGLAIAVALPPRPRARQGRPGQLARPRTTARSVTRLTRRRAA